jgi:hypothetical protein
MFVEVIECKEPKIDEVDSEIGVRMFQMHRIDAIYLRAHWV